jgi:hypothetical protein
MKHGDLQSAGWHSYTTDQSSRQRLAPSAYLLSTNTLIHNGESSIQCLHPVAALSFPAIFDIHKEQPSPNARSRQYILDQLELGRDPCRTKPASW